MYDVGKVLCSLAFYRWVLGVVLALLMVVEVPMTSQTVLSLLCLISVVLV